MTEGIDRIATAVSILDDLLADTTPGAAVSR